MARETQAQRAARLEAERVEREAREAEQYLPRLMTALEEATVRNSFELTVRNGQFELVDLNERDEFFVLRPVYTARNQVDLENLESELNYRAVQRLAEQKRLEAKAAALAKLTKEERELLGL